MKTSSVVAAVVVGIAFVVLMLFLRVLTTPREIVHPASCQSNLKQCAQALKMYSDDYDGQMPSSYLINRSKRWNSPDFLMFATRLGEYPPKSNRKHTIWQVLYHNMKNKDIQWCPSDETDHADPRARTSYWYKVANDKAWYGIGCPKPRRSMRDYAYESDQIAFYERLGWHFDDTKGLHNGVQINVSFMDCHAETVCIKRNATSGDPLNCATNTDGEPMYYNISTESQSGKPDKGPAKHIDPAKYCDCF